MIKQSPPAWLPRIIFPPLNVSPPWLLKFSSSPPQPGRWHKNHPPAPPDPREGTTLSCVSFLQTKILIKLRENLRKIYFWLLFSLQLRNDNVTWWLKMQKLQLLYNSFDKYRLQDARSFLEVLLSASSFNFLSIGKGWNKEAAIFQALEIFFLGREILFFSSLSSANTIK